MLRQVYRYPNATTKLNETGKAYLCVEDNELPLSIQKPLQWEVSVPRATLTNANVPLLVFDPKWSVTLTYKGRSFITCLTHIQELTPSESSEKFVFNIDTMIRMLNDALANSFGDIKNSSLTTLATQAPYFAYSLSRRTISIIAPQIGYGTGSDWSSPGDDTIQIYVSTKAGRFVRGMQTYTPQQPTEHSKDILVILNNNERNLCDSQGSPTVSGSYIFQSTRDIESWSDVDGIVVSSTGLSLNQDILGDHPRDLIVLCEYDSTETTPFRYRVAEMSYTPHDSRKLRFNSGTFDGRFQLRIMWRSKDNLYRQVYLYSNGSFSVSLLFEKMTSS